MNRRFIEIRKWLIEKGIKQIQIADKANVSKTTVNQFCKGFTTSRNIRSVFAELGCPEELLEMKVA